MGNVLSYDEQPVHRPASFKQKDWEIESKVTLFGFQWESLGKCVLSEHRFYYDDRDNYLFSVTDTRRFKQKTKEVVVNVDGINIWLRLEELGPMPEYIPKNATHFRLAERRRFVRQMHPCVACFDELTCDGKTFQQLELEYSSPVKDVSDTVAALQAVSSLTHVAIASLPQNVTLDFKSMPKYEWLKRYCEAKPIVRGVKGWIQKFAL